MKKASKTLNKALSLLLALMMVIGLVPGMAFASETESEPTYVAKVGEIEYETLSTAFAAITDGATVTIYEGTYTGDFAFDADNVTIVGQGNVLIKGTLTIGQAGTKNYQAYGFNITNIDVEAESGRAVRISGNGTMTDCNIKSGGDAISGSYANNTVSGTVSD